MLFVTGDCHGDFRRFSTKNFPIQKDLTKDDLVVILGDGGLIWEGGKEDEWWLNWLEAKPFTTINIGGNHENYDILERYPKVRWHGGEAIQLRPSVYHLCRGYTFDLAGFNTFVLGGAQSHDADLVVLPSRRLSGVRKELERCHLPYRVYKRSWWPQELPNDEEMFRAWNTLGAEHWCVDLVLTHCAPTEIQKELGRGYPTNELTDFLQYALEHLEYDRWLCGHYHQSAELPELDFQVVNEEIILIEEETV